MDLGKEGDILAKLRETEGVKGVYQVQGVYDIVAMLEAESTEKVKETLQENIRKLDNVKSTLTLMAV